MICCYYPTTTVAIDDDSYFLDILTKHSGIPDCKAFTSPQDAITKLKSNTPLSRLQERIIKTGVRMPDCDSTPEDHTVSYNLHNLHEEIYNKKRFTDVSVIIVDYYMGETNGINVCEALKAHPAKKILLTGGADKESLAIDAFNKGIIHKFISKSDKDLLIKLSQAIHTLKDAYFHDLSQALLPCSASMRKNPFKYPVFNNFLHDLKNKTNSIEYYMVDIAGTCLMLDENGILTWLVIKHESDMQGFEKLASDMEAPNHLFQGVAERLLMPFFFSEEDYQHPASMWNQFFYPCQPMAGTNDYYYTIFRGGQNQHIDKDRIIPYTVHNPVSGVKA